MRKIAMLSGFCTLLVMGAMMIGAEPPSSELLNSADLQFKQGNYKDAWEAYQKLATRPTTSPDEVGKAVNQAGHCLQRLGREDEFDAFREKVVEIHAQQGPVLQAVAQSYLNWLHHGYLVEGTFHRGNSRSNAGVEQVDTTERDRVRALQLLQQARPFFEGQPAKIQSGYFLTFAEAIQFQRTGAHASWQLQSLTNLDELPEYEERQQMWRGRFGHPMGGSGAPVDSEGNPIFYTVPESWETANSDGQRFRWLLEQAQRVDPSKQNQVRYQWASFLRQQFGVQTMQEVIRPLPYKQADNSQPELNEKTGPFTVSTLKETETIAKLASGVKRFELPDEQNFIKIFQKIVAEPQSGYGEQALFQLAQIFENRQQYPRAAEYLRQNIQDYQDPHKSKTNHLSQIVDPWGTFEGHSVVAAGDGSELSFRFRNGELLKCEAYAINTQQLLNDLKAYLKSNPQDFDWQKANIGDLGHRLVYENEKKYLGKRVAQWELELTPRENHFDRRITIKTPLQRAGAYLVTAQMKEGNTSRIIVWLDDLTIVKKPLNNQQWYFVADTKTGKPVPNARLDFFGYQIERRNARRMQTRVSEFSDQTNAEGQLLVGEKLMESQFNWLTTATTKEGRFAFLGFQGVWYRSAEMQDYRENKVYLITDRPVYRPGQKVQFKVWVRKADYANTDKSVFAGQDFKLEISNPRSEKLLEQSFKADEFGGFAGEITLPDDATLGVYHMNLPWENGVGGGNSFRVEEYKKPEFEVTVEAPQKPVKLGDKFTATIKAKYYFGAPVVNARVKYSVKRTAYTERWYPAGRWDWLYGNGYRWLGQNYSWYPGFKQWGRIAPPPIWWPLPSDPPEVVLENEVEISPEGTVEIEIDTALAAALHNDQDHKYSLTAEVVDESRRTIVGQGEVLVARDPFQVFVWLNQGYYQTDDVVVANVKAQTLDQKPIEGTGQLRLLSISYNEQGEPQEKVLETWPLNTNAQGEAEHKFKAAQPGQYRLSYQVKDAAGNEQEGGYIFLVRGKESTLVDYRFNDLEIIPEKSSYQPGEKVRLLINTNRSNATVLLFVRPIGGVYNAPQTLTLTGKSTVVEVDVEAKDMPNFFIEAVTLSNAEVFQEVRDILVPPEKRVINVEVAPSSERYLPGQEAEIKVKLTDLNGQPIVGSVAMTVYDRAVEYISSGSNVPELLKYFWEFRRHHHPNTESSLQRYFSNLLKKGETGMQNLGVFGDLAADTAENGIPMTKSSPRMMSRGRGIMEMAAPQAAPMMMDAATSESSSNFAAVSAAGVPDTNLVQPTIRKEFADTAYWNALITPDENGIATIKFPMPENLTDWKIRTWAMGHGTRVGEATIGVVTAKDVLVRLQAPRFFVEKDEVIISANVHNYLKDSKSTRVELVLEGSTLEALEELQRTLTLDANGEQRVDWKLRAVREGDAIITVKALTDADSDAMQMTFPVYVHGLLKTESFTGVLRGEDQSGQFQVRVPEERRPEQTRLEIRYSPTLAGALVDALPYLIDYPYGCTEQTLNRFLPSVITQNVLKRLGLNLEELEKKQTNLNAQELGEASKRAEQWKRFEINPVFSTEKMEEIVKVNLKKLAEMQLSDGGWGWFSGRGEQSYPHTTATVVHGLQIAKKNGLLLPERMLERGVDWLKKYQTEQIRLIKRGEAEKPETPYRIAASNMDAMVYMVLVDAGINEAAMQNYLFRDRTKLSVYSLAMFGLSLHQLKSAERLDMILQNIEQYYVEDLENETAYLKLPAGYHWWYWHGNEIEANAYYLKLLALTDPQGMRAPRLVKYLLNNRKHSTYWNSTRDTALCIEALADYLKASKEDQPEYTLEVVVDGRVQKTVTINQENLFSFDGTIVLEGEALSTGEHTVEFRKSGRGPLYWNAYLTNFTLEDPITATGLELKVRRRVYKLIERENAQAEVAGSRGQVVKQDVQKYDRVELQTGDEVVSGDLLEIELGLDSKNDYEYVILEDFKAAGTEPMEVRSGYLSEANGAYVEFRDEKVTFFFRAVPRGTSSMSYRLRAEIPGKFSALPTVTYGMYAPELKANSNEFKLQIQDR